MIGFGLTALSESARTGLWSYGYARIYWNRFHLIPPDCYNFSLRVPGFQDIDWATFDKYGTEKYSGFGRCWFNSAPHFLTFRLYDI